MNKVVRLGTQVSIVLLGLAVGFTVGNAVRPAAAAVPSCSSGETCWARGDFSPTSATGGAYVQTTVVGLTATSGKSGDYLNQELWEDTSGGNVSSGSDWVEVGYSYDTGACGSTSGLKWFVDQVENDVQVATDCNPVPTAPTPTVGSTHQLEIQETSGSTWGVYLDGVLVDSYTQPSGWSYGSSTGLEYHDAPPYNGFSGDATYSYQEFRSTACCTWSYWPTATSTNGSSYGGTDGASIYDWLWTSTNPYDHGYNSQILN